MRAISTILWIGVFIYTCNLQITEMACNPYVHSLHYLSCTGSRSTPCVTLQKQVNHPSTCGWCSRPCTGRAHEDCLIRPSVHLSVTLPTTVIRVPSKILPQHANDNAHIFTPSADYFVTKLSDEWGWGKLYPFLCQSTKSKDPSV